MIGKLVKGLVVVGLVASAGFAVLGKERVKRCVKEAKHAVRAAVDDAIDPDDEARLRRRLAALRDEYPKRIAVLESDAQEVQAEDGRLAEDERLCERVIALCERDAEAIEAGAGSAAGDGRGAERAARLAEVESVRATYARRLEDDRTARASLAEERAAIERALAEERAEHARVADELAALERELSAIQRNARLIEVLEQGARRSSAELGDDDLTTLARVRKAIGERRAEQEQKLADLRRSRLLGGYERRARAGAGSSSAESASASW